MPILLVVYKRQYGVDLNLDHNIVKAGGQDQLIGISFLWGEREHSFQYKTQEEATEALFRIEKSVPETICDIW